MFAIDFLNTLPVWLALTISITVGTLLFLTFVLGLHRLIEWFARERVIRYEGRYYIVRGLLGDKQYLSFRWGHPDWWYHRTHAEWWPTQEAAEQHLTRPPGPYRKWKQKRQYLKVKAEQEARLKAHQEKMLKVRMDFSNYGCEEKDH